jgi:sulfotransferase
MNKSFDQFVCLAGVPRAGATLLSAILSQNPSIHTEGHSPMCQLMWDTYLSYQDKCNREFAAHGKDHRLPKIIGQIPHTYYCPTDASGNDIVSDPSIRRIVVDRCRSWTNGCNLNMLRSAVDSNIKVIVMVRPLIEVVESYAHLFSNNHMATTLDQVLPQLLNSGTEPIVRAWEGVNWAKEWCKNNPDDKTFIFVTYDELITDTSNTILRIYQHCGWDTFDHDFTNIVMKNPENEKINGLVGQFEVRPQIKRSERESIKLSSEVLDIIHKMESSLNTTIDVSLCSTTAENQSSGLELVTAVDNVIVNV